MTEEEKCAVLESLNEGDIVEITIRGTVCDTDKRTTEDGRFLVDIWVWDKPANQAVVLSNFIDSNDEYESIRRVKP